MLFIVILSIIISLLVVSIYALNFGFTLSYPISNEPEDWAYLGTYLGGILGPIFTFSSIVLLIKSVRLQKDANDQLKHDLERSKKQEKLKTFESRFFHMIDSQRSSFSAFELSFFNSSGNLEKKRSVEAVIELEELIAELKLYKASKAKICEAIERCDSKDLIFSLTRETFVIQKQIHTCLCNDEGFDLPLRLDFYRTLMNFTDWNLLRLLLISVKYNNHEIAKSIRTNRELTSVAKEVNLINYARLV